MQQELEPERAREREQPPDDAKPEAVDPSVATFERLWEILQIAPIGVGIVNLDGHVVLSNTALRAMLGYSEAEFAAMHFDDYSHPDDTVRNRELVSEMLAGHRERFHMDKRFYARDGSELWCRLTVSLLRDDDGHPALHVGMLENVTEQRRLEQQLEEAEATYRLLVERSPGVVYVAPLAPHRPCKYVSPQVQILLGFTPDEWLEQPDLWLARVHPDDRAAVHDAWLERAGRPSTEPTTIRYRMHRREGDEVWVRDEFAVEHDREGELVAHGVMADVTREKRLEDALEHQAFHDSLTGLPNRKLFEERISSCLGRGPRGDRPRGVVAFFDLDDFKSINDGHGHALGDELLCSVADRIRHTIRPGDTAARLGGDEFVVLLEGVESVEDGKAAARRASSELQRPHHLSQGVFRISASVGVALLEGTSSDAALRSADLAMYHAKHAGKGQVVGPGEQPVPD
ncbi:sensor domain-containing diguanylate cyclase [Egibacter rhizosphaerae]|uniref:Sensor domain-containing diguanylate cyclase n=1 Tax=Egibacter rhizosphaerae TaxID=1670831 RepID=A0A411YEB0_9ACTN|nr:sensor domain-containing diguanylate cyclase [Egibacter rhizosphaerae]QBI19555.1 sensor domain-containing diguanylate cyclase [Egibacter rhizosphaerae]